MEKKRIVNYSIKQRDNTVVGWSEKDRDRVNKSTIRNRETGS